jgi:hypothetical protein
MLRTLSNLYWRWWCHVWYVCYKHRRVKKDSIVSGTYCLDCELEKRIRFHEKLNQESKRFEEKLRAFQSR